MTDTNSVYASCSSDSILRRRAPTCYILSDIFTDENFSTIHYSRRDTAVLRGCYTHTSMWCSYKKAYNEKKALSSCRLLSTRPFTPPVILCSRHT